MPPGSLKVVETRKRLVEHKFRNYDSNMRDIIERYDPVGSSITDAALDEIIAQYGTSLKPSPFPAFEGTFGLGEIEGDYPEHLTADVVRREDIRAYLTAACDYEDDLMGLPPDEVRRLGTEVEQELADFRNSEIAIEDKWRFFNHPDASPDYEKWTTLRSWTVEECAALSLFKDPAKVNRATLTNAVGSPEQSHFFRLYEDRLHLIVSAVAVQELPQTIKPAEFAQWMTHVGIAVPDWMSDLTSNPKPSKLPVGSKEPRQATFYKFLIALAISRYGFDYKDYDPEHGSHVFSMMEDDLTKAGLAIDVTTAREHVQAAREWAGNNVTIDQQSLRAPPAKK